MKKINIISLDFDGCIFNRRYHHSKDKENRLISSNEVLLDDVIHKINNRHPGKAILMIGSNRQSKSLDTTNTAATESRGSSESCFPALNKIKDHLNSRLTSNLCEVEPYLLADTFGDYKHGANFEAAISETDNITRKSNFIYTEAVFDLSKIILLYAQMHKMAAKNSKARIVFDFYDDTSSILRDLKVFFTQHPEWIPANTKLRLNHYISLKNGTSVLAPEELIQGTGDIDQDFNNNIKIMADVCGANLIKKIDILERLTTKNEKGIKKYHTNVALSKLDREILYLKRTIDSSVNEGREFISALEILQEELIASSKKDEVDSATLKSILITADETTKLLRTLNTDNGTSDIKAYIRHCEGSPTKKFLKVVATVAIACAAFLLVAGLIFGVGMLTGGWAAPLVVAASIGLCGGTATVGGAITMGVAALSGVLSGLASGISFFHKSPQQKIALELADKAKKYQLAKLELVTENDHEKIIGSDKSTPSVSDQEEVAENDSPDDFPPQRIGVST